MEFQLGASVKPRKITELKKNLPSREIESCNDYECMLISLAHKRIFLFDEQFILIGTRKKSIIAFFYSNIEFHLFCAFN